MKTNCEISLEEMRTLTFQILWKHYYKKAYHNKFNMNKDNQTFYVNIFTVDFVLSLRFARYHNSFHVVNINYHFLYCKTSLLLLPKQGGTRDMF